MPRHHESLSTELGAGSTGGQSGTPSRREFLAKTGAIALGGSAALSLLGAGCATADATKPQVSKPTLSAFRGATVKDGVQHFHSRPDLKPPEVSINTPYAGDLGGYVMTETVLGQAQLGTLIIDQSGRVVWFKPMSPKPTSEHMPYNLHVWEYKGKPVLGWWEGKQVYGHGWGTYMLYDTKYQKVAEIRGHNGYHGDLHDFIVTPQGTALFTAYGQAETTVRKDGREVSAKYFYGVVQEVDIATGTLLFQWRSDHHIGLKESYRKIPTDGTGIMDYFHLNAISIDPSDGNIVIGGRNTWAAYKINRKNGAVIWKLGGKDSDFKMSHGTDFQFQHDVNMHANSVLTLFDNGGGPPQESKFSRGLVLAVNEKKRTVTLKHAYHHTPQIYSDALGSVQPLDGDGAFMGWGRTPNFTRYSADGKVLFDGNLAKGTQSYRAFLQSWEGTPEDKPDIAVSRSGKTATVYASWNGSTALDHWGVLGGSSASNLQQIGTVGLHGFETGIKVSDAPAVLAVRAYDSNGTGLSTSKVVKQ